MAKKNLNLPAASAITGRILPAISIQEAQQNSQGIVRGVKAPSGFLMEDHICEELRGDHLIHIEHPVEKR